MCAIRLCAAHTNAPSSALTPVTVEFEGKAFNIVVPDGVEPGMALNVEVPQDDGEPPPPPPPPPATSPWELVGRRAALCGLIAKAILNGRKGSVKSYNPDKDRLVVTIDGMHPGMPLPAATACCLCWLPRATSVPHEARKPRLRAPCSAAAAMRQPHARVPRSDVPHVPASLSLHASSGGTRSHPRLSPTRGTLPPAAERPPSRPLDPSLRLAQT